MLRSTFQKIYGENEKITYINGFADKAIKDLSKDVYLVTTFAVFQHLNLLYTKRVLKSLNMVLKKNSVLILKNQLPILNMKDLIYIIRGQKNFGKKT